MNSMNSTNQTPHGGKLVNLLVDHQHATKLKEVAQSLPDITLNDRQLCDLEMLATGAFSPLTGFMCRTDYESVLDRMRLQDNTLWPIPICLDISETKAGTLEVGQSVSLRDPEGFLLAILHIEDLWPVEKEKEADACVWHAGQQARRCGACFQYNQNLLCGWPDRCPESAHPFGFQSTALDTRRDTAAF